MAEPTASIRELRLNFRAIKRRMEEHGSITITDNGMPRYRLTPLAQETPPAAAPPNYYARLQKQKQIPARATRELHEENRG